MEKRCSKLTCTWIVCIFPLLVGKKKTEIKEMILFRVIRRKSRKGWVCKTERKHEQKEVEKT